MLGTFSSSAGPPRRRGVEMRLAVSDVVVQGFAAAVAVLVTAGVTAVLAVSARARRPRRSRPAPPSAAYSAGAGSAHSNGARRPGTGG